MAGTVHDVENKTLLTQVRQEAADAAQQLMEAAHLRKGQIVVVVYRRAVLRAPEPGADRRA